MRRVFLIGICIFSLLVPMSRDVAAEDAHPLAGMYACRGVNPDGRPYDAMLELVQRGDLVGARGTFADAPPVWGIGLVREGVLAISYFSLGTAGLVVYRVENDAITGGEWIMAGAGGVYRESLTKLPDDHAPVRPTPQQHRRSGRDPRSAEV